MASAIQPKHTKEEPANAENTELKTSDTLTIELLNLLNEYESIANGEFRQTFIDGYMNLSRANFNTTGLNTYGVDNIDLRSTDPCKVVESREDKFKLIDLLALQKTRLKEQKDKEAKEAKEEGERKDKKTEKKDKSKDIEEKETAISSGIKNMSIKTATIEVDIPSPILKDPIYQFGGLVPYQLRECQKSFNNSLETCMVMASLQRRISNLVDKIDQLQTN